MGLVPVDSESPRRRSTPVIMTVVGHPSSRTKESPKDHLDQNQPEASLAVSTDEPGDSLNHPLNETPQAPSPSAEAAPTPSLAYAWEAPPPKQRFLARSGLYALGHLLMGGTLAVGLIIGIGVWRSGQRFFQDLPALFLPVVTAPEADVRTVVVQQLQGASELTTAIFTMEAIVPAQSDRTLAGYVIGSTNLLYIAHGKVRAGVDLAQITVDDVQLTEESAIRVTLPPPQILDRTLDLDQSTVYHYDRGWLSLGPDNAPQLQTLAQQEALAKMTAAACSTGLLEEANRRAELTVGQLLSSAGFQSVEVIRQSPASGACADPTKRDK